MIIYLFEAIHLFLDVLHLMRLLHCHCLYYHYHFSNTDDDGRTRPKLCASIYGQTPLTSVIERDVYAHLC